MIDKHDVSFVIDTDGKSARAVTDFSKEMDKRLREYIKSRVKVAELDAELNGGALFEVATILGKPLYVRLNHHDLELAQLELAEIRTIVKSVVLGDE